MGNQGQVANPAPPLAHPLPVPPHPHKGKGRDIHGQLGAGGQTGPPLAHLPPTHTLGGGPPSQKPEGDGPGW